MLLSKFKLVLIISVYSSLSYANFSEKKCLNSSFSVKVSHKDKRTFGMAQTSLGILKDKCEVVISHDKLKFFKNKWKIDVCREPVHIKSGTKGVEVLKKDGTCIKGSSSDFCDALATIKEIIQDDGLIFAPGEKEDINTDHGKVYCSYQLVSGYLDRGIVYSRYAKEKKVAPISSSPVIDSTNASGEVNTEVTSPEANESSQGQSGSF